VDTKSLVTKIRGRLAVRPMLAGQALGLGRKRTKDAVERGVIPVTAAGTVPVSWLHAQLGLNQDTDSGMSPSQQGD
jgi:hypothetical protein